MHVHTHTHMTPVRELVTRRAIQISQWDAPRSWVLETALRTLIPTSTRGQAVGEAKAVKHTPTHHILSGKWLSKQRSGER